jgi:hypothetical protein
MMTAPTIERLRCKATVSDRIPDTEFPYRVFCYSPGMGFNTVQLVYVGRNEYRTLAEATEAAAEWEKAHAHI